MFFRATTVRIADGFSITGWVRNEPNGDVLCQVQGEAGEIERFLAQHRLDRPGRVETESSVVVEPVRGESGFVVNR